MSVDAFYHILICRTDNIGDVVLTLPLAGYLKQRYPDCKIDFLVRGYAAPVVKLSTFVDKVYSLETVEDLDLFFGSGHWSSVIFAYPQRKLAQAARRARVPHRVGTSHRLFHWLTCNRLAHFSRVKSDLHEAQLNFALLRPLGLEVSPALSELPSWYGLRAGHDPTLVQWEREGAFHLILHPKSNGNGREWPWQHYLQLAQILQADPGIQIWLTGSAQEGQWLQEHAPALLQQSNVRNLCGQLQLAQLAGLIARADGLIASGTGPLHMAAALGRPTLGLFPPLKPIDPARWGALGVRAQSLCAPKPCSTCDGPAQCRCMQQISPQQVAQVVKEWQAAST